MPQQLESRSWSKSAQTAPRSAWVLDCLVELSNARQRGETDALEVLIAHHPEWDDERVIRVIYEDICDRRERGESGASGEVIARFPRYRAELSVLLEFDRAVRATARRADFPSPGECLGAFTLVKELGRGASARIYLATEAGLANRHVVLKVQPIDQDEHLALARLQNTHVIPLFSEQAFPERGLRALCMPYLGGACLDRIFEHLAVIPAQEREGRHLLDAIDQLESVGSCDVEVESPCRLYLKSESWTRAICWVAACLADALHAAHSRGLVHMDLKPSNILIAGDGLPLLLDFHLARRPLRAGEIVEDRLGGTPGWMSPEQGAAYEAVRRGRPSPCAVDGRCDIHALGMLLATALDGREHSGHASDRLVAWKSSNPEVSPGLAEIVRHCLAIDVNARYASAALLADDLRRHLDDLPLKNVPNRSLRERWSKWRRRRPGSLSRMILVSAAFGAIPAALVIAAIKPLQRRIDDRSTLALGAAMKLKRQDAGLAAIDARGLARIEGWPGSRKALRDGLGEAKPSPQADEIQRLASEHFDLGREHLKSGRIDEAMSEFESATRLCPQDFWSRFDLGVCAYQLDRFDEAATAFRVCEALSPASAECSYNLALALEALDRRDEAMESYSRAISLDPRLAAARLNRGNLSFECGDLAAAIADYNEAIETAVDSSVRERARHAREIAVQQRGSRR
jgi:serine/threonine protein kinase/Flp pilus assembly protein TadD